MKELSTILHLEDEADIRDIVQLALASLGGLDVRSVENSEDALDALKSFEPQLVLVDVMLPGLDGPGFVHEARRRGLLKRSAVVFMTAKSQVQGLAEADDMEIAGIVQKPFDPMALRETLISLYRKWQEGRA